jgi:cell fate (sporulation/competence/biofilm development) regulator YmcA (YheA/YmcA/DUF963 family)
VNKELQDKVDAFIDDFLSVPEVKQYLLLKKQIEESDEIKILEENLRNAQKKMALSLGTKFYEENKAHYYKCKEEYDSNPLVVNYNVLKDEVEFLVDELQRKLK